MSTSKMFKMMAAVCAKMAVDYGQMSAAEAEAKIRNDGFSEQEMQVITIAHQLMLADCPPGGPDKRGNRLPEHYLATAANLQVAGHA